MSKFFWITAGLFLAACSLYGQVIKDTDTRILFHGIVFDANSLHPLKGSQIVINRTFSSSSDDEGRFAFYIRRGDTVIFTRLAYKPVSFIVSDTLSGKEFIAGIYMRSDTIQIDEVVIISRYSNLRSEIFTSRPEADIKIENAKYNLEVSSYQGRVGISKLGDPSMNYEVLRQQQRSEAYTKGQIPSDRIVGLNPFMLIPAAYLLMNGLPGKPSQLNLLITEKEVDKLHRKYLETLRNK